MENKAAFGLTYNMDENTVTNILEQPQPFLTSVAVVENVEAAHENVLSSNRAAPGSLLEEAYDIIPFQDE